LDQELILVVVVLLGATIFKKSS